MGRRGSLNGYPESATFTNNYAAGTQKLSTVTYTNYGVASTVNYAFDGRGNRLYDDESPSTSDRRDYTYDARNNLITVEGKFVFDYSTDTLHDYTLTNAYDHKNRRVFKSFHDDTDGTEAHWFFYYDFADRLYEIKHVPDISDSSTYSLYQHYWIDERPIAYWQVDYPTATTTKRYLHSDHQNRPTEAYSWSTTSSLKWRIFPDLYDWAPRLLIPGAFQPLRFPGQYQDDETMAVKLYWTTYEPLRPPLSYNRYRTYDPFTGGYLQVDPLVDDTWDAYRYAGQNPVMRVDPTGMAWYDGKSLACTLGMGLAVGGAVIMVVGGSGTEAPRCFDCLEVDSTTGECVDVGTQLDECPEGSYGFGAVGLLPLAAGALLASYGCPSALDSLKCKVLGIGCGETPVVECPPGFTPTSDHRFGEDFAGVVCRLDREPPYSQNCDPRYDDVGCVGLDEEVPATRGIPNLRPDRFLMN